MKPPCEIVVNRMLPRIRADIVRILTQEYDMKQIEVSKKLGITQAAVSQYLSETRGGDDGFQNIFPEMEDYAQAIAKSIASGEDKDMQLGLLCEFCSSMREEEKFCSLHKNILELQSCDVCNRSSSEEIDKRG